MGLPGARRGKAFTVTTDRRRPARAAGGSGRAPVPGAGPEPAVGRRPDLRQDPHRVGLRGVHHRRVLPVHRRLAGIAIAAHRPGDRRAWRWPSGTVDAPAPTCRRLVHHSDRGVQYLSIRYTERLADERHRRVGRVQGRQLRQRPGRVVQRALQVGADLPRKDPGAASTTSSSPP